MAATTERSTSKGGSRVRILYRAETFKEGDAYVSVCPGLNVSSFGDGPEDAARSLQEAVEAYLESCGEMGTLEDVLEEAGFAAADGVWVAREPVAEVVREAVLDWPPAGVESHP